MLVFLFSLALLLPSCLFAQGQHPWFSPNKELGKSLAEEIPPPFGSARIETKAGSFGHWLRQLPLKEEGALVMLHDGRVKPYQASAFRVLDIDIGRGDLQQCADAIMRLRAEYLYSQNPKSPAIAFNYTSGHRIDWQRWAKHYRPKISGSKVSYQATKTGQAPDWSYKNFRQYLRSIFMYAGTASLEKELPLRKSIKDLQIGDLFIQGGFPGHAVLVIDMAYNPLTRKVYFLLAQSYMPAQSIHILKNYKNPEFSPWYEADFSGSLSTPEWEFKKGVGALRYFSD